MRAWSAASIVCVALGGLVAIGACESVPELRFAPPDASEADGAADASDGGALEDVVALPDASDDGALCVNGVAPPGAARCCGAIPCYGPCLVGADCPKCEGQCLGAGAVCCTAIHPISCTTYGNACP